MPIYMKCPTCNFYGPHGLSEGTPWGSQFYHESRECQGAYRYKEQWYKDESLAWKAYKKNNPSLDENWVKAFDARILENNEEQYQFWIAKWKEEQL